MASMQVGEEDAVILLKPSVVAQEWPFLGVKLFIKEQLGLSTKEHVRVESVNETCLIVAERCHTVNDEAPIKSRITQLPLAVRNVT
jgi:hypothetical protein